VLFDRRFDCVERDRTDDEKRHSGQVSGFRAK
jgi:hypothetical protein